MENNKRSKKETKKDEVVDEVLPSKRNLRNRPIVNYSESQKNSLIKIASKTGKNSSISHSVNTSKKDCKDTNNENTQPKDDDACLSNAEMTSKGKNKRGIDVKENESIEPVKKRITRQQLKMDKSDDRNITACKASKYYENNSEDDEKVSQVKVNKEKVSKEKVSKEKVSNDKVGKDKVSNNKVSNDKVGKDKVSNDKVGKDKVAKDKVAKDKVGEDKVSKAKVSKAKVSKEKVGKDKVSKENVSKEKVSEEKVSKEKDVADEASKENDSDENDSKENVGKDKESKDKESKDEGGKYKDIKDDVTDSKDDSKDSKDHSKDSKDDVTDSKDDVKDSKDDSKGSKDDSKGSKDDSKGSKDGKELVTVQFSGFVPVDSFCTGSQFSVYRDAAGVDWDCMLNQTNIGFNNNKFYLIQLLVSPTKLYSVYRRWGRIGNNGQTSIQQFSTNTLAEIEFCSVFRNKTKNCWPLNYSSFVKCPGKYDLILRDFSLQDDKEKEHQVDSDEKFKIPDSQLPQNVQDLISQICNVQLFIGQLKELKYDATKAPLGKLSPEQIRAGYSALKDIEKCIEDKRPLQELQDACSKYYTRIPHVFSRSGIEVIDSPYRLKEELTLLSSLDDAQAAMKMFRKECSSINPIDQHYEQLTCEIKYLSSQSDDFEIIKQSLLSTHAKKHHRFGLEVLDIFELSKSSEKIVFKDHGNRRLLWHGSRMMNYAGIIGRGLHIAPPEAPVSGYMFGKGVYFADVSSKSAQYCYTSSDRPTGFLLLAEVALGDTHQLSSCEYRLPKMLPTNKSSTHGVGKFCPQGYKDFKGMPIPMGPVVEQNKDILKNGRSALMFNEFIVYSTNQIQLRYLIKVCINH